MDPRWGLFVLVAVCLLQVPAVVLLARRFELAEELPWRAGYADGVRSSGAAPPPERSAASLCPRCGTENEAGYPYCRRCVARL